jgi:hypothetical protein
MAAICALMVVPVWLIRETIRRNNKAPQEAIAASCSGEAACSGR